jgi:hypothetical protein
VESWPDQKIQQVAVRYIEKNSMDRASWQFTLIGKAHKANAGLALLQAGELPVVSCRISAESWYLLTTRRIVGKYMEREVEASPMDVAGEHFGNLKGHQGRNTEIMNLKFSQGREATLEYETGKASMAPIYYLIFWRLKFPALEKLTI